MRSCTGKASCRNEVLIATVSLSALELEVNVWRVVFHVMGKQRCEDGAQSSRKSPDLDLVVEASPFQSASGQQ